MRVLSTRQSYDLALWMQSITVYLTCGWVQGVSHRLIVEWKIPSG
jgi:hypothetical protein